MYIFERKLLQKVVNEFDFKHLDDIHLGYHPSPIFFFKHSCSCVAFTNVFM